MEPRKSIETGSGRTVIACSRYRDNARTRKGIETGKPEGGFVYVPARNLCRLWWSYQTGAIEFRDVRVWFAAQEMVARRCELDRERLPSFTPEELHKLVGGAGRGLKASLGRLEAAELLVWAPSMVRFQNVSETRLQALDGFAAMLDAVKNNRRLVPVPRRTIRLLAQTGKPSVVATILGHLFRCLYSNVGGECKSWGTCKSSWIAETFGVDVRNVKAARKHLIRLGWLVPVESGHWHRQRWGGSFVVSLTWSRPESYSDREELRTKSPPRPAVSDAKSPPPIKPVSSLRESKNQKPAQSGPAGFSMKQGDGNKKPATWRHLEREDLHRTDRLLDVYEQASIAGDIGHSELERLRFVTAAEHALCKGTKNPCGLFMHLVKKKLWNYCTQDDEDSARRRLQAALFGITRQRKPELVKRPRKVELSADAKLARAVDTVSRQRGLSPLVILRGMNRNWTLEQYERALEKAETYRLRSLIGGRSVRC